MSGVYIRGMEMPINCCHCPLMGYDPDIEWVDGGRETQGAYICVITHELIDNTKREEHCPLHPVPAHGRLIDADVLLEEFELPDNLLDPEKVLMHITGVRATIQTSPTVIEAEEGE